MASVRTLGQRPALLPPSVAAAIRKRAIESVGIALMVLAICLALALATYRASDPSWSHATDGEARNLLGGTGAVVADLLLQTLGLGAFALCAMVGAWGWRLLRVQRLPMWWLRLALLPVAVLLATLALAFVPTVGVWERPFDRGLGGATGYLFHGWALRNVTAAGFTALGLAVVAGVLASASMFFALALTGGEWRAVGRAGVWTVRRLRRTAGWIWAAGAGFAARAPWRNLARVRAQAKEERRERHERREPSLLENDGPPPLRALDDRPRPDPAELVVAPPQGPARPRARQGSLELPASGPYALPPLDLLAEPRPGERRAQVDQAALAQNAQLLESVLDDFGVQGQIVKVRPGPVVTLYELEPAPGTKSSRVIGLADDIARSMSAISVRVAVVPGRNVIGIELPNAIRETVYLRELLADDAMMRSAGTLALALGKDIGGAPVAADLARMPHLLIAGTTGSGKSVAINTMILSLLYRLPPAECRMIMVDPKMLELSVYDGIPHLLAPVVTDPKKAVVALKWAVREMEQRYRAMSRLGVRNIAGYNARLAEARKKGEALTRQVQTGFDEKGQPIFEDQPLDTTPLPAIVVVVDEMADLMLVAGKDIEWAVQRLAQMARAAGIHLIMATQRPSVDVITGTIKANFPTRISFQVTSKIDSRTILGEQGAEQLLGQGDMLYMAGGGRITRVHGPFVSDREVEAVVRDLRAQGEPAYLDDVTDEQDGPAGPGDPSAPTAGEGEGGESDAMYDQAVALVARERKCSTSFIQRHFQIGYNRAARIVERMEAEGVISQANHVGKREVLAPKGDYAG